ncbi:MAG: hypothetical protein UY67_C0038G0005 [Candidatus Kaiserbacteria bacterium GW2011_GWA2_52_12]|uniref:Uncharacterized protein n=1 Tax=Candidatus Kaiserbacteria bacterium GW2011_GWA2_52_12 TaxID=1618671 RepID=A0A0G1WVA6_9BACT|nr:MAG: hypothetical protein UY67_C0038G0005 [Candidatus Kaiserbacteria bacterium GW2011_GWA2_52_12]
MSFVAQMSGTLNNRKNIRAEIARGLHSLGSCDCTQFYTKTERYPPWKDSDVVVVGGKLKVFTRGPNDPQDPFSDKYLSSDFVVVLEKPDTLLYQLHTFLPNYRAELAMVKMYIAILFTVVGTLVSLVAALVFGLGWWSLLCALGAAVILILYFAFEYWLRAALAGVGGVVYVWRRIIFGKQSRQQYQILVAHLANSEEYDVAVINKIIQKLI